MNTRCPKCGNEFEIGDIDTYGAPVLDQNDFEFECACGAVLIPHFTVEMIEKEVE